MACGQGPWVACPGDGQLRRNRPRSIHAPSFPRRIRTPSPRRGEGGVRGVGRMRKTPASEPPHPRSRRSLDLSPLGRGEIESRSRDAPSHPRLAKLFPRTGLPTKREAERRKAQCLGAVPRQRMLPSARASGTAARHTGECCHPRVLRARTPPGAPPRRLPRKLMPWLGPGRVSWDVRTPGVTRRALSQSSEAPRRPVVMPAKPMPGTARERGYKPRPREPHPPRQSAVTGDDPFEGVIRQM